MNQPAQLESGKLYVCCVGVLTSKKIDARTYLHWHNVCHRDLKLENWVSRWVGQFLLGRPDGGKKTKKTKAADGL